MESRQPHEHSIWVQTRSILFLGTPNHGAASLAKLAKFASQLISLVKPTNSKILRTLQRESEVLARIQDSFHAILKTRVHDGLQPIDATYCYEELPFGKFGYVCASKNQGCIRLLTDLRLSRESRPLCPEATILGYTITIWIWSSLSMQKTQALCLSAESYVDG